VSRVPASALITTLLVWGLTAAPLKAATLVELTLGGEALRLWSDGRMLRLQAAAEERYALYEAGSGSLLEVDPELAEVIDLSALARRTKTEALSLRRLGDGPRIAGMATQHYTIEVGERTCGEAWLSLEVLERLGVAQGYAGLRTMAGGRGESLGENRATEDLCTRADASRFAQTGFPLRLTHPDGSVALEVTRIQTDAPAPAGGFVPPADYARVGLETLVPRP
jgi:hypothetical protein